MEILRDNSCICHVSFLLRQALNLLQYFCHFQSTAPGKFINIFSLNRLKSQVWNYSLQILIRWWFKMEFVNVFLSVEGDIISGTAHLCFALSKGKCAWGWLHLKGSLFFLCLFSLICSLQPSLNIGNPQQIVPLYRALNYFP